MKLRYILILMALVTITACAEKAENPPIDCTMEYAPVCGIDGVTYGNDCSAGDIEIAYQGECKETHLCTEEEKAAQICTADYTPVCGDDGETYGNGCGACSAGVDSWIMGEC